MVRRRFGTRMEDGGRTVRFDGLVGSFGAAGKNRRRYGW